MIETWTPLLLIGVAIALWMNAMRARERAVSIVRHLCERANVQLLDQSVALRGFRFTRIDGRLALRRRYGFDVSVDGNDRHRGYVDIKGDVAEHWSLPWSTTAEDANKVVEVPRNLLPGRVIDGTNVTVVDFNRRD